MSSGNLLKVSSLSLDEKERIIDVNDRITKRLKELSIALGETSQDGFNPGLAIRDLGDMSVTEDDGNVIKAQSEAERTAEQLEQQRQDALREIEDARAQAQSILQDARTQAQAEKQQVLDQARRQGLESGRQEAARELEQARRALEAEQNELEAEYERQVAEFEPRFVDSITNIYETIFTVDLSSYREILLHLLENAMRKAESSHEFLIRVSAQDYPYVSMHKKELTACAAGGSGTVMITEDASLKKNQCLIETDGGIFDCGLETQLTELGQKLRLLSYDRSAQSEGYR